MSDEDRELRELELEIDAIVLDATLRHYGRAAQVIRVGALEFVPEPHVRAVVKLRPSARWVAMEVRQVLP